MSLGALLEHREGSGSLPSVTGDDVWLLGSPLPSPAITTLSHKHGARTNENRSDKSGSLQDSYRCVVQHVSCASRGCLSGFGVFLDTACGKLQAHSRIEQI